MKTRANSLGRVSLVLLGAVLCFADFVSAAQSTKNVNTNNYRTGAVTGQLTATFGNQVVYGVAETATLTPLSGGQTITTKTNGVGRFLFQNVPAGQYEFRAQFEWSTGYVEAYDDGTRDRMWVDHFQGDKWSGPGKTETNCPGDKIQCGSSSRRSLGIWRSGFSQASPSLGNLQL